MRVEKEIRDLRLLMKRFGETVSVVIGKCVYHTKCFNQSARKTFHVRYNDDFKLEKLGVDRNKDVVLFISCDSGALYDDWVNYTGSIFVKLHGQMYEALADSVISFNDHPLYFWVLARPVKKLIEGYYDELA